MSSPSIFSAFQKLQQLLTKQEKLKWLTIAGFAMVISLLEIITASVIVVFAQVLSTPEIGKKYLASLGFSKQLSSGHIMLYFAITVGVVYLIKNSIAAAEAFYQNFSIQAMNLHFKNKLLHRYSKIDYGFYLTRNSSLGIQVVNSEVEQVFSSGMIALASILSEGFIFLCLIIMIVYLNPSLALAVFGIGLLFSVVLAKVVLPKFYQFGRQLQESSLHSYQNLTQFFHAFKEILILGKREAFIDAYQQHALKRSRIYAMQTAINALPRIIIEVLFVGLFVVTIAILCLNNESPAAMMGILGGYLYTGFRLMPGLNRIINQLNTFKSIIPSIDRVHHEYMHVAEKEHYQDIPELQFNNEITLKNINFRYLNTPNNALSQINLTIKKGECIGIIGETGSGKSTLVDIILGLLNPSEGLSLIDGTYPVHSIQWHQKIGYVSQSIYLTDDTIEANIAFGEAEMDISRLNMAIEAAQLRKFIEKLPNGTKTIVGERGVRLSGGERQRIAIARALYRNPEVLIFDEATSALDNETEAKLIDTIRLLSQNRTVIMIAHRLTTLRDCSRIVNMEKGCIKEITQYHNLKHTQFLHPV